MHVAIRGEGNTANQTFERPFPRMHKNMAVQRARGAQCLMTDLAREGLQTINRKVHIIIVVRANVKGEVVL
jgi:hypothetical protein